LVQAQKSLAMRQAIFLDRDGVINRSFVRNGRPYAPTKLKDFEVLPNVAEALEELRRLGFLNIVVTNQPDLKSGIQSADSLEQMHRLLLDTLAIDAIEVCPHNDEDNCSCRKPRPGLILRAANRFDIDISESFMIGDRWRDVLAGQAAGCRCLFIDYGYSEKQPTQPFCRVESLPDAVSIIVSQRPNLLHLE